ncbi:MAG TPA: phosphoenolpyruvate--protein phosphotransferase [Stellaceae bacterium]|nr:phosphoenolpyruvate--protein phosphotransferase [Stellaceae bacterium]
MAGTGSAQSKLDAIVRMIAADMVAEVCSCYVMRPGEVLELFATEGLRPEAVHNTRLRVGEGLVGVIAATALPLSLSDAQSHPDFAYRPETGEEIYHSLLGVPLLRNGRVVGVLVVQNRTRRNYNEDDAETMQTVAMIVAELAASSELIPPGALGEANWPMLTALRLDGVRLNGGLAKGVAVLHAPRIVIKQIVAEDPAAELRRLRAAIAAMRREIDDMLAADDVSGGGEHRDVLEAYRMFAADGGWTRRMTEAVLSGLTAEAAVQKVQDDNRARMAQAIDPYLRDRLADLEDLGNRLQQHLAGKKLTAAAADLPDEFVLFAREMGPAELLDYDRKRLKGLVLEEGSPTSHVAIIARALDIPVIGRVENALVKVDAGDIVIVDGDEAQLVMRPGEDVLNAANARLEARAGQRLRYAAIRGLPAETRDGARISLNINAGLLLDLPHLDETGADGIGLFRTELLFMLREKLPNATHQAQTYRRVLEQAGGRPVTFRTLDIGGDKVLPYMTAAQDENPAMGWRAIRISLDRPALLRQQLRAMIQAASGQHLRVMFPMVADAAEFDQARAIFDLELARARTHGHEQPAKIELGVMLEVPSLFFELPQLLPKVDFVSVGTNDLVQFLYAADRNNPRLIDRYDPLSGPVLRLLRQLATACRAHNVPLAVCGEMAGEPLAALALVGIGLRTLSMSPANIGPVKEAILGVDLAALGPLLDELDRLPSRSLRGKLHDFARDHGVPT